MRISRKEIKRIRMAARPKDPIAVIEKNGNGRPVLIAVSDGSGPRFGSFPIATYRTLRGAREQANGRLGLRQGEPGVVLLLELHRLAMVADDKDLEGDRVVRMSGAEFAERQIQIWADIAKRLTESPQEYEFSINRYVPSKRRKSRED